MPLRPGVTLTLDLVLQIPSLSEHVSVTAKAPAAKDAGEALANLDGIWKIRKGGIANDIVLRGFQQANLAVLIDGLRIYGACPNHMDPSAFHVDFAEIESGQVTKDPFNVLDQGSLGGSINIVRKKPLPGLHFTPDLSAGSFGYYNPSLHHLRELHHRGSRSSGL